MRKTTNRQLFKAGDKAVTCAVTNVESIEEPSFTKELLLRTAHELGVETTVIAQHLEELHQLNKIGHKARQVWKDVDGVLTCDSNIYSGAQSVPYLTFDEAAELAYFGAQVLHPLSMRPARDGDIPVRVKNSYNPNAPGTVITRSRDMSKVLTTFEDLGISVDVVATSEVSISLTLNPAKLWGRELVQRANDHVVEELEKIAVVKLLQRRSIISLIGNVQKSSLILEKVFKVLRSNGVNVQMISQGASKVSKKSYRVAKSPAGLFFQHTGHRDKVVDFNWNAADPWTLVSVSDDCETGGGGGKLQV